MLLQARARGLAPREVSEYVRRCLETRRVGAACVECNAAPLHLLCSELAGDHGYISEGTEVRELSANDPPLAVRRSDVLVTTLFHAHAVHLRVMLVGRDDLEAIPRDAPTYVMTSAREYMASRYAGRAAPGHPIHPARSFSDEAARELLTFLVRANMAAFAAGLS
jgi:hypothetical protein